MWLQVREEFRASPYEQFDPVQAWEETIVKGRDPARVISPLMTSMQCYASVPEYFPNGLHSSIEGRDILDVDPAKNPLFNSYNHIIIPYCSSDLWLGEEINSSISECDCFSSVKSSGSSGCFTFDPNSSSLQFTFRGKSIFQNIILQLLDDHDMINANRVILAGSSTGGLGVANHAKWTRDVLGSNTELMVLLDSAWFIDYQDSVNTLFNVETTNKSTSNLFSELSSANIACNDTDWFGYPCCISAYCIMTQQNSRGQLQYYPEGTPTFTLFSIYDLYLLSPALTRVTSLVAVGKANTGDNIGGITTIFDFLRVAVEYGGAMNYTLNVVTSQVSRCVNFRMSYMYY